MSRIVRIAVGVFGRGLGISVAVACALVLVVFLTGCGRKAVQVQAPEAPPQLVAEGTTLVIGQLYPVRLTLIERRESDGKLVRTWYFIGSANPHKPDALTPPVRPHMVNDIVAGHMRVVQVREGAFNGNSVPWVLLVVELHPAQGLHPQKRVPILKGYEE